MNLYIANVLKDGILAEPMPVESNPTPRLEGDEGVIVQYGDVDGLTCSVIATDEDDAERRIVATFGDDAWIDDLQLTAPLPALVVTGLRNLSHAGQPCDDPDCEIHHPEVIEDTKRLTAMAWFEAGRRS